MENATKALLIAAGVMISIMILSLLVLGYNEISSYYQTKQDVTQAQQVAEFNSVYNNYNRKNVRGSDLISLMNRIIDYNEREVYADGTNYKRIAVTIEIGDSNLNQFKYYTDDRDYTGWDTNELLKGTITNKSGEDSINDQKLIEITGTVSKLSAYMGVSLDEQDFQVLSSNVANILLTNTDESSNSENSKKVRQKRDSILKSVGINIGLDANFKPISSLQMQKAKSITHKYYQYSQFKRAYFNCTECKYDEQTGRVCEMKFEVSTKNGSVVFN